MFSIGTPRDGGATQQALQSMVPPLSLGALQSIENPVRSLAELQDAREATAYRGVAARGLYLSADRPELRFAVKELARNMARPRRVDVSGMKRFGRFLARRPRLVCRFGYQGAWGLRGEAPQGLEACRELDPGRVDHNFCA